MTAHRPIARALSLRVDELERDLRRREQLHLREVEDLRERVRQRDRLIAALTRGTP